MKKFKKLNFFSRSEENNGRFKTDTEKKGYKSTVINDIKNGSTYRRLKIPSNS